MANTSDGGEGDSPDPLNANINPDALLNYTPAVHSAKNNLVPTKIDRVLTTYSNPSPPAHSTHSQRPEQPPILNNNATSPPDNTDVTLSTDTPAVHSPKNDSVPTKIDRDLTNYNNPRPTAHSARSNHPDHSPILTNITPSSPGSNDNALSLRPPAIHSTKNEQVMSEIDQVSPIYNNKNDSDAANADPDTDNYTHMNDTPQHGSPTTDRLLYSTDSTRTASGNAKYATHTTKTDGVLPISVHGDNLSDDSDKTNTCHATV